MPAKRRRSSRHVDFTGQTFGFWTVVRRIRKAGTWARYFCRCACGSERIITAARLRTSGVTSCGCRQRAVARQPHIWARLDLSGKRLGWLTVKARAANVPTPGARVPSGFTAWYCECACKRTVLVTTKDLTRPVSPTRHCGCKHLIPAVTLKGAARQAPVLPPVPALRPYVDPESSTEFDVVWDGAVDRHANGNGSHGHGNGNGQPRPYVPDMPEHTTSAGEALRRAHDLYSPLGRVRRVSWPAGEAPGEDGDGVGHCVTGDDVGIEEGD